MESNEKIIGVTKAGIANQQAYSIKTTIPAEIVKALGIKEKDQIIWVQAECHKSDGTTIHYFAIKVQH
ncbi:MAG: AbrB/MazE/SpoVT family DNA-binding domain-containing protein [Nitrososphaerota archaeon]|jgi:hypothetical protein|nr:AbrB/MazE/SpoVT family DNA-binding domain-containing protein [Nitrososphaerota archaeon]MDG6930532.1 AbrB/MazE/SpoVT family DNA-binding domain-containing protein [Nitrososphaerota archaeon]